MLLKNIINKLFHRKKKSLMEEAWIYGSSDMRDGENNMIKLDKNDESDREWFDED